MQKHTKQQSLPSFRLTLLAISLFSLNNSAFAMQELNEQSMRQVDGQDGLIVNTQYDSINIDRLYWEDKAGMATGVDTALRGYADGVSITGADLGTTYKINAGSSAANKAGMDFKIESRYGTIKADSFKICDAAGTGCGDSIGGLAIQSQENATLGFITEDGLFNQNSLSKVEISLKRMNVFLTQQEVANNPSSVKNQLIFKDFNFNFTGAGYMYISEAGGLILETRSNGYVDLTPVEDLLHPGKFKPGLNIDIVVKNNTANTISTTDAKGLIRIGASGRLTDGKLVFRGVNGLDTAGEAILGKAFSAGSTTITPDGTSASILGSSGIALRLSAKFTNGGTNPTVLELGHGGTNAYGIAFSNFTPLLIRKQNNGGALNGDQAYFDSGNVYINLTDTKRIQLPVNSELNSKKFLTGTLTTADDYSQLVSGSTDANPKAVVAAFRGMDFQAISRSSKFISSTDVSGANIPDNAGGTWGLGLPIYNLNGNLALYGATSDGAPTGAQRLGFALGITTQGVNKTALPDGSLAGSKTTSILLIDGKKYNQTTDANGLRTEDPNGDPINYYIGVRNIDMLLSGYGTIGLESGRVNINVPKFTFAASGEVAVGYLPGSQYKTAGKGYAPIDGFLTNKDVLFGLRLRMDGSVDMTLNPGTDTLAGNRISFDGLINLTDGAIQIVEPTDSSIVGFDGITGTVAFSNQIKVNKADVDFNTAFTINPNVTKVGATQAEKAAGVLRVKNLNFYPTGGAAQRLGEMVFTGGKLTSQFNIKPN